MKSFDLQRPTRIDQAVSLLPADHDDDSAQLMAGGQDLLTVLKQNLAEPDRLVSLRRVSGLDQLRWNADGSLTIGALVSVQDLADDSAVATRLTVLSEAAASVGSPQIRAMGTVGGNLNQRPRCWYFRNQDAVCLKKGGDHCFALDGRNKYNAILGGGPVYIVHPSDLAPALVSLDAEVTLAGRDGERRLPLADYYLLPEDGGIERETVREPDEIVTAVHVPAPRAGMTSTYLKFQERGSYDWALSSVALCLWRSGDRIDAARLTLGGVAPVPWRCPGAETLLAGRKLDDATCRAAGNAALSGASPMSDNAYKVPLAKGLITRALRHLGT